MQKEELDYKSLAEDILEGACKITLELFDLKRKHGEMKMDVPKELQSPLIFDALREMWAAWYIADQSGVDQETLKKLAEAMDK